MEDIIHPFCIPLHRKRMDPTTSPVNKVAKHLRSSPGPTPDSTLSPNHLKYNEDGIEEHKNIDNNMNNFRRFSGRSKKQTNFFCPLPSASFHRRRSKDTNAAVRALKFSPSSTSDQQQNPVTVNEEQGTVNEEQGTVNEEQGTVNEEQGTTGKGGEEGESEAAVAMETTEVHETSKPQKPQDKLSSQDIKKLPIGSLVWGKLPGYEWWPGCIINFDKKNLIEAEKDEDEDDEEEEEEEGEKEEEPGEMAWVKWYGDNQLSQISVKKMFQFGEEFLEHFTPNKMKGMYKKAVINALKEAARRCSKDIGCTVDERKPSWIFHLSQFTVFLEERKLLNNLLPQEDEAMEATPVKIEQGEKSESPVYSPDSSSAAVPRGENNLFTPIIQDEQEPEGSAYISKGRAKRPKSGQLLLSVLEKELFEWALNGFLPTGPEGFRPRPEHLIDIKVYPVNDSVSSNQLIMKRNEVSTERLRNVDPDYEKKTDKLLMIQMRNKIQFESVKLGQLAIEDICIACGSVHVFTQHPLFHGGLCKSCKETFMECAYMFDEDGTQMYCTICSGGSQVFMCDTPNCSKVYCNPCIEKLCGSEERAKVQDATEWQCYMCSGELNGLLRKREDWDKRLHELFITDIETEYESPKFFPPIPAEKRKPMRVLGLFDGIGTGLLVLKELGINVEVYIASEIDPDAIKVSLVKHPEIIHVGAIEHVTEKEVRSWGPFDLVFGGSPCNDLSIVNPARKGIYDGTGRLFFEFFRILGYAKPHPQDERPFFWLYENVVSMRAPDKKIISRFLQCNPVIVDARDISAAHRARFFWGNLPGMNRPAVPLPGDRLSLQQCLEPNCFRHAQFTKLRTITTKMNSIKQTKRAIFPVRVASGGMFDVTGEEEEEGDVLWCTEMERLFGFPDHYTDVGNLGRSGRQKLLGKAWSVPVIRHLLSPLKDYFKSNTTGVPSSLKQGQPDNPPTISMTTLPSPPPIVSITTPPFPEHIAVALPVVAPPPKYLTPEPETVIVFMKTDEFN